MSPSACHKQSLLQQARARILVSAVEICISSEALVAEELYNIYSDNLFIMIVIVYLKCTRRSHATSHTEHENSGEIIDIEASKDYNGSHI